MSTARSNQVELAAGLTIARSALKYRFARSGGPGGQNVNKLNTKATLAVALCELGEVLDGATLDRLCRLAGQRLVEDRLVISSTESRSQLGNRRACLAKLRQLIVQARQRPRVRKPTRPSRAANERRLQQKSKHSQVKRLRRGRTDVDT